MNFNRHSNLEGAHSFLGASNYHWLHYDDEKLALTYARYRAKEEGTILHDFARRCIEMGISLEPIKETLNMYVNDCVKHNMHPEQLLYFSENSFGTADAISFDRNILKIFDLKTGVTKASMDQLKIYSALFCLEYGVNPSDIEIQLRIYQSNDITKAYPEADEILYIMDKIVYFDKLIEQLKEEDSQWQ